jgi:guanylate kinase
MLEQGKDVVLVIDVQGARQVRRRQLLPTISVFVLPPSFAILEQRLRGRCNDPEDAILRRLAAARDEVAAFIEYDYVVVNDDVGGCVDRLRGIVMAERARLSATRSEAERIVATFRKRS